MDRQDVVQKKHHFKTSGRIFSFGYGPKYDKNHPLNYSFDKYVDKTSSRKTTPSDIEYLSSLEKTLEQQIMDGIDQLLEHLWLVFFFKIIYSLCKAKCALIDLTHRTNRE